MSTSPFVAVPGLGLGPESWRPTIATLGDRVSAAVEVLPGYGVPVAGGAPPPLGDLAAQLVARLTSRGDGPVVLAGHSSSCQVVAQAARLAPGLVSALLLVGPTTDPRARSWPGLATLWLRTASHEDPRQVPVLVRQYRRTTLRSMRATMEVARHDDLRETLTGVASPVVLVRGRHDRIARGDWLRSLVATGSDRTVVELPAGAHMVPLTHPDLLAESLGRHMLPR